VSLYSKQSSRVQSKAICSLIFQSSSDIAGRVADNMGKTSGLYGGHACALTFVSKQAAGLWLVISGDHRQQVCLSRTRFWVCSNSRELVDSARGHRGICHGRMWQGWEQGKVLVLSLSMSAILAGHM